MQLKIAMWKYLFNNAKETIYQSKTQNHGSTNFWERGYNRNLRNRRWDKID